MYYAVVDLEMSGLDPLFNDIIQIGACLYNESWDLIGTYTANVYPENEFNSQSTEVHGIRMSDLEDAPLIYDALPSFEEWIYKTARINKKSDNLRNVILCGQSVINDINFLKFAYKKTKAEWPFSNKLIDLHTLAYFYFRIMQNNGYPTPSRLSLDAISGFFGISRDTREHNALEDASITAECFKKIFLDSENFKI